MSVSHKPDTAAVSGRNVVAVLGPTNTGKTHLAIERMLGHATGVIGLPLRLLAREVYTKVAARVGADPIDALVVDLARQQPQRQPDDSRRMAEHPLDGEMGLAGIGRPKHGGDARAAGTHVSAR